MTTTEITGQQSLVEEIRNEHRAAFGNAVRALEHARRCGELLHKQKRLLAHGKWLPWLKANIPEIGTRQAQKYIKLHHGWRRIQAKNESISHLTIDGAMRLLTAPAEPSRRQRTQPTWEPAIQAFDVIDRGFNVTNQLRPLATNFFDGKPIELPKPKDSPPWPCDGHYMFAATCGGRLADVASSKDPSFGYANVVHVSGDQEGLAEGSKKPINRFLLFASLFLLKFPTSSVQWFASSAYGGWGFNQLLYDSHEQYVDRAILGHEEPGAA